MHAYYILNIFRVIHHFPWRCEKNQVKKGASGSAVAALLFRLFFFCGEGITYDGPCVCLYTPYNWQQLPDGRPLLCRPLSCDDRSPFHFHALKRVNISKKHRRAELYNPSCTAESRYLNTDCCAHTDVVQSSDAQHPPLVISLVFWPNLATLWNHLYI
jgi:hypothetical protein